MVAHASRTFALLQQPAPMRWLWAWQSVVLVGMLWANLYAAGHENLFQLHPITLASPWFWVTVAEAYLAFIPFCLWVALREQQPWPRWLWIVAMVGLGNWVMALYGVCVLWGLGGQKSPTWGEVLFGQRHVVEETR